MLTIVKGDLFKSNSEAFVNTVNLFSIMGKGIALEFKKRYPECFFPYVEVCRSKELKIGSVFVWATNLNSPKYIIHFPTKIHWKNPSKISYIEDGLKALIYSIKQYEIKSIAIPALGCTNGGLDWNIVKDIIIKYCNELPEVQFNIFEPLN